MTSSASLPFTAANLQRLPPSSPSFTRGGASLASCSPSSTGDREDGVARSCSRRLQERAAQRQSSVRALVSSHPCRRGPRAPPSLYLLSLLPSVHPPPRATSATPLLCFPFFNTCRHPSHSIPLRLISPPPTLARFVSLPYVCFSLFFLLDDFLVDFFSSLYG